MKGEKFDARLRQRLESVTSRAKALGRDPATEKVPVTIEIAGQIEIPRGKERREMLDDLMSQATALQKEVMEKIKELGAEKGVQQNYLSNSISAELTVIQLREIERMSQVKRLRLRREDKVTC